MGCRLTGVTGGLCAALAALSVWEYADSFDQEVYAVGNTASMSVHCIAPDSVAFVPEIIYTIQPHSSPALAPLYVAVLVGPVNGQDNVTTRSHWQPPHTIIVTHATPTMKLAGLQCKDVSSATLHVRLDYTPPGRNVAITSPQHSRNPPHHLIAGQTESLFGTHGQISAMPLHDGRDADHHLNGEIAFGGDSPTTGGTTTVLHLSANTTVPLTHPQLHFMFASH